MSTPTLIAVHVGRPQVFQQAEGNTYRTSLFKTPVCETILLGTEDLDGNGQANLKYHGGPDKAVCCYPSEHYAPLSELLGQKLPHGALGENFTLAGMLEDTVCVGDRYRVGDAIVEISQPRQPCNTLVKRWGDKNLPRLMAEHGWTGFYARVIEEGMIQAGDEIHLLDRPLPQWTIAVLNELMSGAKKKNEQRRAEAAALPQLSSDWKQAFGGK